VVKVPIASDKLKEEVGKALREGKCIVIAQRETTRLVKPERLEKFHVIPVEVSR